MLVAGDERSRVVCERGGEASRRGRGLSLLEHEEARTLIVKMVGPVRRLEEAVRVVHDCEQGEEASALRDRGRACAARGEDAGREERKEGARRGGRGTHSRPAARSGPAGAAGPSNRPSAERRSVRSSAASGSSTSTTGCWYRSLRRPSWRRSPRTRRRPTPTSTWTTPTWLRTTLPRTPTT